MGWQELEAEIAAHRQRDAHCSGRGNPAPTHDHLPPQEWGHVPLWGVPMRRLSWRETAEAFPGVWITRAATAPTKAAFRVALRKRRCLILAPEALWLSLGVRGCDCPRPRCESTRRGDERVSCQEAGE